jgi:uncharacterized protein YjcR
MRLPVRDIVELQGVSASVSTVQTWGHMTRWSAAAEVLLSSLLVESHSLKPNGLSCKVYRLF